MGHLMRFETKDGTSVVVEVADPAPEGGEELAAKGDVAGKATQTFEEALQQIRPVVQSVLDELRDLVSHTQETQIQFGITLSGKVGVFITAGVEANFVVSLTWKQPERPDG